MSGKINILLFGIGNVGSALITKAVKIRKSLILDKGIDIRFPVITNSTVAFFEKQGANYSWEANFIQFAIPFKLKDIVAYVKANNLENVVVVDATASTYLAAEYLNLINSGFNIVSVNKALPLLTSDFEKEVNIAALNNGLDYTLLNLPKGTKHAVADALLEAVLQIAQKKKQVA